MTHFAFMDTNAGFFQYDVLAESRDAAIKVYAKEVGLIEEIALDMYVAEVSEIQIDVLRDHFDFTGLSDDEEAITKTIEWSKVDDEAVRAILGYASREAA